MIQCNKCGRILPKSGEHKCASVDLKGERHCTECSKVLSNTGWERWSKICRKCSKRQWRDKERQDRRKLREQFGDKCSVCGYDKCKTALHFHHLDSSEKYDWNVEGQGGASIREIKHHPERFKLLCANCHIETHNPDKENQ